MKTYEEYKVSGVKWLGKVPKHWEICRFKDFISLQTQTSLSENKIGLEKVKDMVKDICICEGKFYSFDGACKDNNSLFDFEKEHIIKYIGNTHINSTKLLDIINDDYIAKYGYISCYSSSYLKSKLVELENDKKLKDKEKKIK